jgi:hypothetical protein
VLVGMVQTGVLKVLLVIDSKTITVTVLYGLFLDLLYLLGLLTLNILLIDAHMVHSKLAVVVTPYSQEEVDTHHLTMVVAAGVDGDKVDLLLFLTGNSINFKKGITLNQWLYQKSTKRLFTHVQRNGWVIHNLQPKLVLPLIMVPLSY